MARETLASLRAQVEALRHNLNLVETERDSLRAVIAAKLLDAPKARPTRACYTPPPATAEQLAFRARMAAARELAMSTGSIVRV